MASAYVTRVVGIECAGPGPSETHLLERAPGPTVVVQHGDNHRFNVGVSSPGVRNETIDHFGTKPTPDEVFDSDEVVDAGRVAGSSCHQQGRLPSEVVIKQVALDETERLAVAFDDEDLALVGAVDYRAVVRLNGLGIGFLSPPRTDVGCT